MISIFSIGCATITSMRHEFKKILPIFLLIILAFLLSLDLIFHQGIFKAHDIEANISRLGAFYLSIKEGNLLPGWAEHVANGYGSPILLFSYLTPYYAQLPFIFLGLSLITSTKLLIVIAWVASAVTMFVWLRQHFSNWPAWIASLLYVYAPYRISDIYARGSISEHVAFVFIPLVGLCWKRVVQKPTLGTVIALGISLALLFYSHPFLLVITFPMYVLYTLVLLRTFKPSISRLGGLGFSFGVCVSLCASLIVPMALERKYLHYEISPFTHTWENEYAKPSQLILPQWTFKDRLGKIEYQTWQIGLVHLGFIVIGLFMSVQKKTRTHWLIFGLITTGIGIFMSLKISKFVYAAVPILQQIQFPWRFGSLISIMVPFVAAAVCEQLAKSFTGKKQISIFVFTTTVLILFINLPYARGRNYNVVSDNYYLYEQQTNTEGLATTPIWAASSETYTRADVTPKIIEGDGEITMLFRKGSAHVYQLKSSSSVRVVDETFYFPNWQVIANKQPISIEFQDPNYRGLITYRLDKGDYLIETVFKDTKIRYLARIITLFSTVSVVLLLLLQKPLGRIRLIKKV